MWTKKYRPTSYSEVAGNKKNIKKIKKWSKDWSDDQMPLALYGQPGTGKTTTAYCVGYEKNWEIMEMNASDKRTGSIVDRIAGEASKTASLFGKSNKLIIIDEADNLHGNYDRGGKKSVGKIIKNSKQPIILICNDYYDLSRNIRDNVKDIEFKPIGDNNIAKNLRDICESENIEYSINALKTVASNSNGDLRAAVNDLQKYAKNKDRITISDLEVSGNTRNQKEKIFEFMDDVFKNSKPKDSRSKYKDLDMSPDELIRWIKQNISNEFGNQEYVLGTKFISRSDIWLGRVRKTQNYKFWRYAGDNISAGISSSRNQNHSGWTRWQPPRYKSQNNVSIDLLKDMSEKNKVSIIDIQSEIIPYVSQIIEYCKPKDLTVMFANYYNIDKKDLSKITGSGKNTNKVSEIIDSDETLNSNSSKNKENSQFVKKLKNVNGIGEKTAKSISDEISEDELDDVEIGELSDIKGVSENKAKDITEFFNIMSNNKDDSDSKDDSDNKDDSQPGIDDFI
jgi:replication factor C large subunit